jgi:ribosomal protein S18 acetylase RimI-like enzyme
VVASATAIRLCEERDLAHFARLGSARHVEYCRDQYERGPEALAILLAVDSADVPVGKVHLDFEARAQEEAAVLVAASVTEPLRRRGIGTELMLAAEALACDRGSQAIVLGVEDSNPAARRLYDRLGYHVSAAADLEYEGAPRPNPGVWMRKDLSC